MRQSSFEHTPQQNGVVKRKHRHILEVARALRIQSGLPIKFWGGCVLTTIYLINYTPTPLLSGKSPYEILFSKSPFYLHFRVFGCLCYVYDMTQPRDKFCARSKPSVFMGYPHGKKEYKVYGLEIRNFCVSRDIIFYETHFPFLIVNQPFHLLVLYLYSS